MKKSTKTVVLVMICLFLLVCAIEESISGGVIGVVALMIAAPFEVKEEVNDTTDDRKNIYKPKK